LYLLIKYIKSVIWRVAKCLSYTEEARCLKVNKTEVDTPDELLAGIFDAAACMKKREDQLRRTTRDPRTRVEKCVEVGGGIFEHLL